MGELGSHLACLSKAGPASSAQNVFPRSGINLKDGRMGQELLQAISEVGSLPIQGERFKIHMCMYTDRCQKDELVLAITRRLAVSFLIERRGRLKTAASLAGIGRHPRRDDPNPPLPPGDLRRMLEYKAQSKTEVRLVRFSFSFHERRFAF